MLHSSGGSLRMRSTMCTLRCARVPCNCQTSLGWHGRSAGGPVRSWRTRHIASRVSHTRFLMSRSVIVWCGRCSYHHSARQYYHYGATSWASPALPPSAETRPLSSASDSIATPKRYSISRSPLRFGGWELQLSASHCSQSNSVCCMHAGTCATAVCLLRSILGNRGHVTTSDSSVQQLEMLLAVSYLASWPRLKLPYLR